VVSGTRSSTYDGQHMCLNGIPNAHVRKRDMLSKIGYFPSDRLCHDALDTPASAQYSLFRASCGNIPATCLNTAMMSTICDITELSVEVTRCLGLCDPKGLRLKFELVVQSPPKQRNFAKQKSRTRPAMT
jgi:hypothetical protein